MGLSETLKAISAPVRREILDYLKSGPKSAGEISQQFDLAPATVSHHLSTLRKAGLLKKKNRRILSTIVWTSDTSDLEKGGNSWAYLKP